MLKRVGAGSVVKALHSYPLAKAFCGVGCCRAFAVATQSERSQSGGDSVATLEGRETHRFPRGPGQMGQYGIRRIFSSCSPLSTSPGQIVCSAEWIVDATDEGMLAVEDSGRVYVAKRSLLVYDPAGDYSKRLRE